MIVTETTIVGMMIAVEAMIVWVVVKAMGVIVEGAIAEEVIAEEVIAVEVIVVVAGWDRR